MLTKINDGSGAHRPARKPALSGCSPRRFALFCNGRWCHQHWRREGSESKCTVHLYAPFTTSPWSADVPVVVPPSHHVLIVGSGGDLEPLDVFIGAKEQGVVSRGVVWRSHQKTAHLADFERRGSKTNTMDFYFKIETWFSEFVNRERGLKKRRNYPSSEGCKPLAWWSFRDTICSVEETGTVRKVQEVKLARHRKTRKLTEVQSS